MTLYDNVFIIRPTHVNIQESMYRVSYGDTGDSPAPSQKFENYDVIIDFTATIGSIIID